MKNDDAYKLSFEFFPPKTPEGLINLNHSAALLASSNPQFFSVTFGAGGSTCEGTLESVKMLLENSNINIAPHISCVGVNADKIKDILAKYKALGLKRIVALRGDLPSGMGQISELKYAAELIKLIRQETGDHFHIDVAAYPEVHPQAKDALQDLLSFKLKYEAGANSAITQYFYNADAYFNFVDECVKHHIYLPIVPGIMPITQFHKLQRFSQLCGAEIPRWIGKRLEAYGDDTASIKAFGLEVVHQLCQRLLDGGAPGLHFYTLNNAEGASAILASLKTQPVAAKKLANLDCYAIDMN